MAGELWNYAVEIYRRPGVAQLCLSMQDKYGVNVNLLLFVHWLHARQIPLTEDRLDEALALVADWDSDYVQVLRRLRRQMKDEFADRLEDVSKVRDYIKATELAAEKQELFWLEQLANQWMLAPAVSSATNGQYIAMYLAALGVDATVINHLQDQFTELTGN